MQMRWRMLEKCRLILDAPDVIDPRSVVELFAPLARVDRDLAATLCPREDERQHRERIVGLPHAFQRQPVTPIHEHATGLTRRQRPQREITKLLFDDLDLADVVGPRPLAQAKEVLA